MDVRMGLRKVHVMRAGGGKRCVMITSVGRDISKLRRQRACHIERGMEHKAKHSAKRPDWNEGRKQDFSPRKKQFLELIN